MYLCICLFVFVFLYLCMPICIGVFVFGNSNDGRKFLLVTDEYPCSLIFPPLQSARPALKKIWLTNKNSHTIQLSTLFLSLLSKLIMIALHFDETWKISPGNQEFHRAPRLQLVIENRLEAQTLTMRTSHGRAVRQPGMWFKQSQSDHKMIYSEISFFQTVGFLKFAAQIETSASLKNVPNWNPDHIYDQHSLQWIREGKGFVLNFPSPSPSQPSPPL